MKTTLNLDDQVFLDVKQLAASRGTTVTSVVEEALRRMLADARVTAPPQPLDIPVVRGASPPPVDIADRRAMYDYLDAHDHLDVHAAERPLDAPS